jgi:hypothetical protein
MSYPSWDWEIAERHYPQCSVHWDAQDGSAWLTKWSEYSISIEAHGGVYYIMIIDNQGLIKHFAWYNNEYNKWVFC